MSRPTTCFALPLAVLAARSLLVLSGALVSLFLTALTATAQTSETPVSSPADVAEGQQIFFKNCALCHGGDATGGRGPDLSRGFFRNATTDERLLDIVQNGMGTGMPWTGLSDRKARQVVAFIRSLSGREVALAGDPERGRELFLGTATCGTCHMVDGKGGRQGPDLSWIGWRRAPDYLRTAVLDPSADVEPRWWTVEVVTRSGTRLGGILVDEDQFTVRLLDENDHLHSLAKRDLEGFERTKTSRMPSFRGVFSDEELTDIVAYLSGLRGGKGDR